MYMFIWCTRARISERGSSVLLEGFVTCPQQYALRLLSVAGLRSGECVEIFRNHDQEELKGHGEALANGINGVVMFS
jgi:hypothetical protein